MIIFLGITHVLIGLVFYTWAFGINIFNVIFVALGSLFPDIDVECSKLGRYNPFARLMRHRGRTHTIIVALILSTIVSLYNIQFGLSFGLGYILHLIADTMTPMGIMWAYPYNKKYYSFSNKDRNLRNLEGVIIALCMMYLFAGKII